MILVLLLLLLISVLLEGTVTALPLVFICLLCMTIVTRDSFIFLPAFIAGILLDAFALRPIGEASIFLLLSVFIMLLYQRKYEINSYPFVFIASFLGSFLFLILFGYSGAFVQAIVSACIAVLLFALFRYMTLHVATRS
jgi:cell shape-determining protein MreD